MSDHKFIASSRDGVACCANCALGANQEDHTTYCTLTRSTNAADYCCPEWELKGVQQ